MKVKKLFLVFGFLLGLGISSISHAITFSVIHNFVGTDGANPAGRPSMDSSGYLYGTTQTGGKSNFGTIFSLNNTSFKTLHHFNGANGNNPWGSLLADADGNLYGTTLSGGQFGFGEVFSYDRELGLKVIKSFAGGQDGLQPFGGVTRDAAGYLYGTTFYGGNMQCGSIGCGTIFKISPQGIFQQLHSFDNADGYGPNATLFRNGNKLYGATVYDSPNGPAWAGSPYYINSDGTGYGTVSLPVVSYNFMGGLIKDKSGNLWGVAMRAGSFSLGGIYKIDTSGVFHLVFEFNGVNGAYPTSTLVLDAAGNLYGTTKGNGTWGSEGSGEGGLGTVFKFNPTTSAFATIHTFTGLEGKNPFSGLIIDPSNRFLYGVTQYGGTAGKGVVYRIGI